MGAHEAGTLSVVLLVCLLAQALAFGFFCAYIAREKGRGQGNWFLLGFLFSFLAVLALVAIPRREVGDGETTAKKNRFEYRGVLDVADPSYQLFLTRKFAIEKNQTLDVYVIGNEVFQTLNAALVDAHQRYVNELSDIGNQHDRPRGRPAPTSEVVCGTCSRFRMRWWDPTSGTCDLHNRHTLAPDSCPQHSPK